MSKKTLPDDFHIVIEDLEMQAEFCEDTVIARKTEVLLRKFAREAGYDLDGAVRIWVE